MERKETAAKDVVDPTGLCAVQIKVPEFPCCQLNAVVFGAEELFTLTQPCVKMPVGVGTEFPVLSKPSLRLVNCA